ncbi:DUF4388 domain-containing protein [Deinococcus sp.]|uniref:DUF4388 domain-containing protein n=1 Tax=Deinococcus sp. TaxID=47478 RepID=UPI0025F585B4|nr:DUF4388 domain-containing protein [Deinococcus sp.]
MMLIEKRKFLLLLARQAPEIEMQLRRHSREAAKWRIETFSSVASVLVQFENFPPDLVVMDPASMDGSLDYLLEHAKLNWPRTFFSLLTDQPESDFQSAVERYGNLPVITPGTAAHNSKAIEKELVGLVNGTLEGLGLASFLQMMEWEAKSVAIHVSVAETWGRMHLRQGKFVSAYVHGRSLSDEDAASEILAWENVKINVERSYHNQKHASLKPLSSLIMDAMRRKDEALRDETGTDNVSRSEDAEVTFKVQTNTGQADPLAARLEHAPVDPRQTQFEMQDFELITSATTRNRTLFDEDAFMPIWTEPLIPARSPQTDDDDLGLYIIQSSVSVPSRDIEQKLLSTPVGALPGMNVPGTNVPGTDLSSDTDLLMNEVMNIEGVLAAALIDVHTGQTLDAVGIGLELDQAGATMTEMLRLQRRAMDLLGIGGGIEDLVVTLDEQYHLLYLLPGTSRFLYVVLRKEQGSLPSARHRIRFVLGQVGR